MKSAAGGGAFYKRAGGYGLLFTRCSAIMHLRFPFFREDMQMIRKILALMLALTVVLCMMPASALAEDGWWNILLLGGDARSEKRFERTDGMIILSINLEKNQVKMTSLMRDTYLQFPGYKNKHKLNAANVYGGPELTMSVINESFGTDIDQYVLINMVGLTKAIDMLGGVEMTT